MHASYTLALVVVLAACGPKLPPADLGVARGGPSAVASVALPFTFASPEALGSAPPGGSILVRSRRDNEPDMLVNASTKVNTPLSTLSFEGRGPFEHSKTWLFTVRGNQKEGPDETLLVRSTMPNVTRVAGEIEAVSPDGTQALMRNCNAAKSRCLAPMRGVSIGDPKVMLPAKLTGRLLRWTATGRLLFHQEGRVTVLSDKDAAQLDAFELDAPNGVRISRDGALMVWDTMKDKAIHVAPTAAPTEAKAFSLESASSVDCVFAGNTRLVCVISSSSGQKLGSIELATGRVVTLSEDAHVFPGIVLSPDEGYVAFGQVVDEGANVARAAFSPIDRREVTLLSGPEAAHGFVYGWVL